MAELSAVVGRSPGECRKPVGATDDVDFFGGATSLADMVLGFFEEEENGSPDRSSNDDDQYYDDEEEENSESITERKAFWEKHRQILKETLCRTSSLELRIRNDTEQALKDLQTTGTTCVCLKPAEGCRICMLRNVSDRLRNAGYDSSICRSKWRSSPDIPSGEHIYIDVVSMSSSKNSTVRVVIELNFRAEFEMARASPEYNRLIDRLPQVFVGKAERLKNLIKILCEAAKKCMKENKMHLGPWRKHKYMLAKWVGSYERMLTAPIFSVSLSGRQPKPRASMLTSDLVGNKMPSLSCRAVEVV